MLVRRLGALTEALHAVVYFAPEPQQAYADLGLRGYWRGYFASRTAALGACSPQLATALLGGFSPAMVARALPSVWATASPGQVLAARRSSAAAALQRLLGTDTSSAAADALVPLVTRLACAGRPMAAAQMALEMPDEPFARLWHCCTVLREHRGDGHLAALAVAGLSWPEPHVLAQDRLDPRQQQHRGWDDESWRAASKRMTARALVASQAGRALAADIEATTDVLASAAWEGADLERVQALLEPLAAVTELPMPNAMGLVL